MNDTTAAIIAEINADTHAAEAAVELQKQQAAAIEQMNAIAHEAGLGKTYSGLLADVEYAVQRREAAEQRTARLQRKIDDVEAWLKEMVEDDDIPQEVADSIADMLGIELTEESKITLTIEVNVTHRIGSRNSIDESDLQISIEEASWKATDSKLSVEDWDVTDCSVDEA